MIRILWAASIHTRYFLRRYAPTNRLLDTIHTRRGLKWGLPAMLLAAPYLAIAYWLTTVLATGGPDWLNLIVLLCVWNAFKMLWIGPISLVLLTRERVRDAVARRRALTRQPTVDESVDASESLVGASSL